MLKRKESYNKFYIYSIVFFVIGVILYHNLSKNIEISYLDEVDWVGRSYYFVLFIRGDFSNDMWIAPESYDHPNLTKYMQGAWIYPSYLIQKYNRHEVGFDYIKFLISNGFWSIDDRYARQYLNYSKRVFSVLGAKDGSLTDYSINLIRYARIPNYFLLAGTTIISSYLIFINRGFFTAFIFSIFFGFNNLLVQKSLLAQSEGLFLFLFNLALVLMAIYFTKGKRTKKNLVLFSIVTGLCMSTKLNGIMISFIFILIVFFLSSNTIGSFKKRKNFIIHTFLHLIVVLSVFIILNPFVWRSPFKNIKKMYTHRLQTSRSQAELYSEDHLVSYKDSFLQVFKNFYKPGNVYLYNNLVFNKKAFGHQGIILALIFTVGLFSETSRLLKGNSFSLILLYSFVLTLGITSYYLVLNWQRYYVHLVLFFVYFQSVGLVFFVKNFRSLFVRIIK